MVATNTQGLIKRLGPGVITGAADDDPSGIATYSQAGAQAGFGLLWTVVLTWPLMVAVQSVSARIGRVTFEHVPRERNKQADRLSNVGMDQQEVRREK